ncbi:HET-domain-containing protein [Stipitochalara longipes BDJ]|nr:HET-domain-containing protein [Stipitochalara longipes BDJ]
MCHNCYSRLSPRSDSIRLLGLLPNKDETAPIQCEVFEYSVQESSKENHLYEALSYVWGSPETPKSISIGKHSLPVTANLHAALSRLRNHSFKRIIWVDFVCINQKDEKEKEHQIQLMVKIYGQANRVIVYLGEPADDSDQALEYIRAAAVDESKTSFKSEKSQNAILRLLEQPWFRRIWVLQEVAAARSILIMYGSAEISEYAFCLGFDKLELSYAHPDLQSLIRSVIYLMRGAALRPKYTTSSSGRLSLGELIDMYHTREATKANDMVYALLGMSSDPNAAGLSPDYMVPWKTLLRRLIEFILPKGVSVEPLDERKISVIKSKGYILGQVSSVESDGTRYDRQLVNVVFNNTPRSLEYERKFGAKWTLQASAKSIRQHDFVCILQGASNPTIIRRYKDHFAIIMIAVTLRPSLPMESRYIEYQESSASTKHFLHDFLLVWNWEKSPENSQDRARYETSLDINTLVPEYLKTALNKAARLHDVALVLGYSKEYEEAEKRLQEAIKYCEGTFGNENPRTLAGMDSLALIYISQQQWKKATNLLLQVVQIRKAVQGIDHKDTLGSIANLALVYMEDSGSTRKEKKILSLTNRIRDNIQITEEDMVWIIESFGMRLIILLLDLNKDNIPVTEYVVKAAACSDDRGKEVMELLLDRRGNEIKITGEVVKAAARSHRGKEVMELLLDRRGNEIKITGEVVKAAARSHRGKEVMELLLNRRGDEFKITEEVVKAGAGNYYRAKEVIELLLDRRGSEVKITEEVVRIAAGNREEVMELLLDRRGDEFKITEEVVKAGAGNYYRAKEVIELLLDRRGSEVKITEEVVRVVAGSREEVMELLLDRRGDEVKITEEVIKAAAGKYYGGEKMIELLLDRRSDEVKITTAGVVNLAKSRSTEEAMQLLLNRYGNGVSRYGHRS